MTLKRLFGKFSKIEKQDDGTLYVEGIASSEAVDSDGDIIKSAAMSAALPDYMKFGALREMHQAIAAGKTLSATVDSDGVTHIAAKVVDPVAIKKVEEGVYSGFSIGGRVTKREKNIIEALKLVEISLVDRPANPDAVISLFKADLAGEPADGAVPAPAPKESAASKADAPAESKAAAPAEAAKAPEAAAAPAAKTDKVAKGMYQVQWAAALCDELAALAVSTQFEADYEGDGSAVPGRLKAVCAELCAVLRELVAEETAELAAAGQDVALAEKPGTLKKSERLAGVLRKFAAGVKTGGAPEHVHFDPAHVATLSKFLGSEPFQKALAAIDPPAPAPEAAELQKRAADAEEATKLAGEALKKISAERDTLTKANADLQKQLDEAMVVVRTKGTLRVVEKKDDTNVQKTDEAAPPEGTAARALHEIKKAQAVPFRLF